jgi:allophanate hydrolase
VTSIAALLAGYRDGTLDPAEVVAHAYERARAAAGPAWIALAPWGDVQAWLARLRPTGPAAGLPLYGVPFAIKDNIDLAGTPTTAACPAFAFTPDRSAFVVERLIAAGAIPIGKTNMDQFATGLTGTRTPYGACASVADPRYVSGGSSSGSAVVVADGSVPFALGTDTAGSGRVPASFNAIVGLKPSLGRLSTRGVVPACRSLDCVSLLTIDVADAARLLAVAAAPDPRDPYARAPAALAARPPRAAGGSRIAVPRAQNLTFAGDAQAAAAWRHALRRASELGWELTEIDFAPFAEAAALLYGGPWVAERYAGVGAFIAAHRADVDPTVRAIIMAGRDIGAAQAFQATHRVRELALACGEIWRQADALLLPTAPTLFTAAEIAEDPVARNTLLGTYTNFVNLLDLCAVAVPAGGRADGLPFGVSLIAPAGADRALLTLAAHWRGERADSDGDGDGAPSPAPSTVALAVAGAHLSGEPLNGQLVALGARLRETVRSASTYRLYALPDTTPAKPGLVGGAPAAGDGVELEIWELATEAFGRLVAAVPAPLSIGTITLADGRAVKGFLCESSAVAGAPDITAYGGWRAYRAQLGSSLTR